MIRAQRDRPRDRNQRKVLSSYCSHLRLFQSSACLGFSDPAALFCALLQIQSYLGGRSSRVGALLRNRVAASLAYEYSRGDAEEEIWTHLIEIIQPGFSTIPSRPAFHCI